LARCDIAVAAAAPLNNFDGVASRTDTVESIESEKNSESSVDPKPSSFSVVDNIVHHSDVVGLVVNPRSGHEFKSSPLPGGESSCSAVSKGVSFDKYSS
jgi:hypothetical protein